MNTQQSYNSPNIFSIPVHMPHCSSIFLSCSCIQLSLIRYDVLRYRARKRAPSSFHILCCHSETSNTVPSVRQDEVDKRRKLLRRRVTTTSPDWTDLKLLTGTDAGISSPHLRTFFGDEHVDTDKMVMLRALYVRRQIATEILKKALQDGKLSINYSTDLVSTLPDFIDYIVLKAASLKHLPQLSSLSYNVRVRITIDDSKVVPLVRWLKDHSLSYPLIGELLCSSGGNINEIRPRVEWLISIGVKQRFLRMVLVRIGKKILKRSVREMEELVSYLDSRGVRRNEMGDAISRCPQLLLCSEDIEARVGFYLSMGINEMDFARMVIDYPKSLGLLSLDDMNKKVTYLEEFGLHIEEIGRILIRMPILMVRDVEEKLKPIVKYLYYLGLSREEMKAMLITDPVIFCIDLEKTIAPKLQFLRDNGVEESAIGRLLVKFPSLLTCSLKKKMVPVVGFLVMKAKVPREDVGKVVYLDPKLLCSLVHKLEGNLKYFLSLGLSSQQLSAMIVNFPSLIRYNISVLRPKYRYFHDIMVRSLQDIVAFPRYFSYNLEIRIARRHKILVNKHLHFALDHMLACTDNVFEQRVEVAVRRRQSFEMCVPSEKNY